MAEIIIGRGYLDSSGNPKREIIEQLKAAAEAGITEITVARDGYFSGAKLLAGKDFLPDTVQVRTHLLYYETPDGNPPFGQWIQGGLVVVYSEPDPNAEP